MKNLTAAMIAGFLALQPPAASAQPNEPAVASERELDAYLAFVRELGEAGNEQLQVMRKLGEARPLMDSLVTPAGVRANGGKLRAILAEAREGLRRVADRMASINPPATGFAPVKPATILAESRDQNRQMTALLQAYDDHIAAALRGDSATVLRTGPQLMLGAYLYMDALRTTMRNRQAAVPRNHSAHQGLEVGIQLYRGMAAAGRAWYNARLARQPASAVATLREELAAVARNVRAAGSEGSQNLTRELAELQRLSAGTTGKEAETFASFRAALGERGKLLALAEEIALWAEAGQSVTGAELASQPTPVLLGKLLPLETRFHALGIAQATAAGGGIQP